MNKKISNGMKSNQLIVMPFDHRASFSKIILGIDGEPKAKDIVKIKKLKQIVFDGFLSAVQKYPDRDSFAVLTDQKYGSAILASAKKKKITVILPIEKSGQEEFAFEFGSSFGKEIKKINPDYVKVLVRYNPGNKETNERQLAKLKKADRFCHKNGYPLLFELLVPPTDKDLKRAGNHNNYDCGLRLARTVVAIKEIKQAVRVSIWKLEGFDATGWKKITRAIDPGQKIIVLGRGENKQRVINWLKSAKRFPDIIGFAIGRTIFLKPLQDYVAGKISRAEAEKNIAGNLDGFVKLWRK